MCALLLVLDARSLLWLIVVVAALAGVPQGLINLANQNALYAQADPVRMGSSAGLLRTCMYLGAIASSAVTAAAFPVSLHVDAMTDRDAEDHRHSVEGIFPGLGETGTTDEVLDLLPHTRVVDAATPPEGRPGAVREIVRHNGLVRFDERAVTEALRAAGARFGFVHGSRAAPGAARPESDLDVAAWWGAGAPDAWDVRLPAGVDLLVLDTGPLWLTGRVAQYGRLLFDDEPAARVAWQADTRLRYLDERPAVEQRYRERTHQIAHGAPGG